MGTDAGAVAPARYRSALTLALAILVFDQASKWWILLSVMQPPRQIEILPFFNLVLTYNRGVSFGLLSSGSPWQPWLLSGMSLVIVTGLLVWLRHQVRRLPILAIGMVVGGAIGNVIDRAIHPGVVDFLDFHAFGWHWPAFNVADSGISIGVCMLILDGLFWDDGRAKQGAEKRPE